MTDKIRRMSKVSSVPKPRKANPKCGTCAHPISFHARDPKSHRRPCNAFGCKCKKFTMAETETASQ